MVLTAPVKETWSGQQLHRLWFGAASGPMPLDDSEMATGAVWLISAPDPSPEQE